MKIEYRALGNKGTSYRGTTGNRNQCVREVLSAMKQNGDDGVVVHIGIGDTFKGVKNYQDFFVLKRTNEEWDCLFFKPKGDEFELRKIPVADMLRAGRRIRYPAKEWDFFESIPPHTSADEYVYNLVHGILQGWLKNDSKEGR